MAGAAVRGAGRGAAARGAARGAGARAAVPVAARGARAVVRAAEADAEAEFEVPVVTPDGVKDLLDRGYTIVDIRSPQEVAETGSKRIWEKIPLAAMTEEGPVMNRQWLLQMKGKFPNKMSRILLACDDGTERTEIAADFLNDEGYTAVQAIDGGIDQYLEEFPLEEKDKIVWKMSDADRSGPDTSALLHGVSTEQVNTIEGPFM